MKRWPILLLMMMLTFPLAFAGTQVQLSTNNSTWYNINTTFGGAISDPDRVATAEYLEDATTYYVRVRNDTTWWGYSEFVTEARNDNMTIIVALMMFGLLAASLATMYMFRESRVMVIISGLIAILTFPLGFRISALIVEGSNVLGTTYEADLVSILNTFYFISIRFFVVALTFAVLYLLIKSVMLLVYATSSRRDKREGGDEILE